MSGAQRLRHRELYGDRIAAKNGGPSRKVPGYLSAALGAVAVAISSCAPAAAVLPTRTPTVGAPAEERAPPRQDTTEHRVRMMLEEGETLLRIVTTKTHILAMTDRSLLSFERHREEDRLETEGLVGIRALEECIRTDMRDFHADGIAGWTAEGSTVYILTESDRSLTILPLDRMGEELQTFNIPFETSGAHMAFRHGVLFITRPTGDLLLMQFSEEGMTYRNIDVPGDAPDPELFDSERRLLLSGEERKFEIRVEVPKFGSPRLKI